MIKELLLSSIISFSVSVRTPNDDTKPLDYEYSVKADKNEGKFTYYENLDYERDINEDKHEIRYIEPRYAQTVVEEFNTLVRD